MSNRLTLQRCAASQWLEGGENIPFDFCLLWRRNAQTSELSALLASTPHRKRESDVDDDSERPATRFIYRPTDRDRQGKDHSWRIGDQRIALSYPSECDQFDPNRIDLQLSSDKFQQRNRDESGKSNQIHFQMKLKFSWIQTNLSLEVLHSTNSTRTELKLE